LIKSKPDLVRDFMRAYVEGIHYAKTHRKETLDILAKYLRTDDKDILDETYESIMATLVPEKPYPTLKGIQIMLRELGAKDPAARAARPEQFVDLTFVKELDTSGFVDRLYKSQPIAKAPARPEPAPAAVASLPPSPPSNTKAAGPEEKVKGAGKPTIASLEKPQASQPPKSTQAPTTESESAVAQPYVVKAGDTLSRLAARFYNSMDKWQKIYEANRDVVKNPDYIYIGQKLVIPPAS
jgi:nucleoid-associated protein YgaU